MNYTAEMQSLNKNQDHITINHFQAAGRFPLNNPIM